MTFMANLAANPSGSIYGQPSQLKDEDALGIVNRLKDREMQDFKDKSTFMADLSLKQDRLKRLYDTPGDQSNIQNNPAFQSEGSQSGGSQGMAQNVVMAKDPNAMTGYEKGELSIRQQGQNLDSQKLAQQGKMGQEALNIKGDQEKLNQQKSDQINAEKNKKMENDMNVAKNKLDLAYQQLSDKTTSAERQLELHKTIAENTEAYHKLQMERGQAALDQKDAEFQQLRKEHQALLDQNKRTKQTKTDSSGNSITTETEKGDAAETVNVIGKDGKPYTIPKDKLDDKDADGTPHWKPVGGNQDQDENEQ